MDPSIGLRQVHQLLSGLFVSSASAGKIADSLAILINPKSVASNQIDGLNPKAKELLMCRFRDVLSNRVEWCSYRHQDLMKGDCEAYALSGISAFPLPAWPFFGKSNPSLNIFEHLVHYLPAYHPSLIPNRLSENSLKVVDGGNTLFVSHDKEHHFLFSVFANKNSLLEMSFYGSGLGACILNVAIADSQTSPVKKFERLDELQYEGNVYCCQIDKSTPSHVFSLSCFLENGEQSLEAVENILDYAMNSVTDNLSLLGSENSLSSIISIAYSNHV